MTIISFPTELTSEEEAVCSFHCYYLAKLKRTLTSLPVMCSKIGNKHLALDCPSTGITSPNKAGSGASSTCSSSKATSHKISGENETSQEMAQVPLRSGIPNSPPFIMPR